MAKMRKINNISAGEDLEQMDYSYTAGGSVNWYNYFEKNWQTISAKAKHIHAQSQAILLLGIYPR